VSQAAHSHTIHSELKTISSYLFPLKSWPTIVPVDQNHINHRGRGCVTLVTLQGSAGPLWRISPCQLLTLTTPGLPAWSGHPARISISLHQSEGPVLGSTASFSRLKGDPRITSGVHTSWFQGLLQAAEPGTSYSMGFSGLISLGPPEMLWEEGQTSENKTQTRVVGRKEDSLR
jgi:hypothetical protein